MSAQCPNTASNLSDHIPTLAQCFVVCWVVGRHQQLVGGRRALMSPAWQGDCRPAQDRSTEKKDPNSEQNSQDEIQTTQRQPISSCCSFTRKVVPMNAQHGAEQQGATGGFDFLKSTHHHSRRCRGDNLDLDRKIIITGSETNHRNINHR